jgi:uroporphyrinogen III methyltransferase/synthase
VGLLTRKAAQLLRIADVVVHDALISDEVLKLIHPGAQRIHVGKRGGRPSERQERINEILVKCAQTSRIVVRLKGGDPFIFGRGGEEALALREAGVPFEVVPGVTAAVGAAAYAGIPLTHRDLTSSVTFVTGHNGPGEGGSKEGGPDEGGVDWEALARLNGTIALYMGVGTLDTTVSRLLAGGRPADTPAAVIEWGTYSRQRVVRGSLGEIAELVRARNIGAPALVVIGEVAVLADQLSWFGGGPLQGRRVVMARTRHQPSRIAAALRARGAEVIEFPRLTSEPAGDSALIDRSLSELSANRWLLFTSPAAVGYFWALLAARGQDARALGRARIAAFGEATRRALVRRSITVDLATRTFDPETVLNRIAAITSVDGARILFPHDTGYESPIAVRLREAGARVEELGIFQVVRDPADSLASALSGADAIVLPSSWAAHIVAEAVGADTEASMQEISARVVAIGPRTAEAARTLGLPVDAVAEGHAAPGVVEAVLRLLTGKDTGLSDTCLTGARSDESAGQSGQRSSPEDAASDRLEISR